MRRLFISNPDLDGVGYIVLLKYFCIQHDDILVVDYDFFENQELMDYAYGFDQIFFVDFAPDKAFAARLFDGNKDFHVYDHHETGEFLLVYNHPNIHIDLKSCGTRIFYEEFIKENSIYRDLITPAVETFVHLVWVYDTWQTGNDDWEEGLSFNRVLYRQYDWQATGLSCFTRFIDLQSHKLEHTKEWLWTLSERKMIEGAKLKEESAYQGAVRKLQFRVDSKGFRFGVIKSSSKISLTCNRILNENPDMTYIVAVNTYGGMTGRLSFRAKKGFNCNDLNVAAGHDVAAGGQIAPEEAQQFLQGQVWSFAYADESDSLYYLYPL